MGNEIFRQLLRSPKRCSGFKTRDCFLNGLKVIIGTKHVRSLNDSISIFICHRKLDELGRDVLARRDSRTVANHYQIPFAQTG